MTKFIKFCALTGLILLLAGVGITSGAAALGARFSNSLPSRIFHEIKEHVYWDDWDDWDDWDSTNNSDFDSGWTQWQENNLPGPGGQANPDAAGAGTAGAGTAGAGETAGAGTAGAGETQGSTQTFSTTRKLSVNLDQGSLRIHEEQGISQIQINVNDPYNETNCYMDHDTLKIKRSDRLHRNADPKIDILVPEGYVFDKVELDMGAAECSIDQIKTAKLDIDAGVGSVVFTGTVSGDVDLDAGVGKITLNLSGRQEDYNYSLECGVGSIHVGNQTYSMLAHKIHVNNNAANNMDVECGVGLIQVNFDESA